METICVQRREGAIRTKKLRHLGFTPVNAFGESLPDPISVQLKESDARRLLHQKREGSKLILDLEGTGLPVQIKEKEIDITKGQIQYIGFQVLTADGEVNSVIHILLVSDGKIPGQFGKVLMEISYASLPGDTIDTITVDLDGITVGAILTVEDIPGLMSDKIGLKVDLKGTVLRISERKHHVEIKEAEQSLWNSWGDG